MSEGLACEECGSTHEVIDSTVWWEAGGRHCFDFNWYKSEGHKPLCKKCEDESWQVCEDCGALIEQEYHTHDWPEREDEYDDVTRCPECIQKYFSQRRIERGLENSRKRKAKIVEEKE